MIVLGTVEARKQVVKGRALITPAVEHSVRVRDVLKGANVRLGDLLVVTQLGGAALVGRQEIVADDRAFPVFRQGATMLFLLVPHDGWGYVPAWGRSSVYPVQFGQVQVPAVARATTQRSHTFGGRSTLPVGEFAAIVRRALGER